MKNSPRHWLMPNDVLTNDIAVPGEPRKFKAEAVNSTSVQVEWKAPANKEKNGIIRGYQVHYIKVNDREEPVGSPLMFNVPGAL